MRVLVIDDEPDVLLLCRVNFEFAGHEVLQASDGESGIEEARSNAPDVIVLDVMLPNMDGLTVLSELHDTPETANIPVVLLTARIAGVDQLRGYRAGADEYVTKPFSPTQLTETIERVAGMDVGERSLHREQALEQLSGFAQ